MTVWLVADIQNRPFQRVLATSLFGDKAAAPREDGSATLDDEHCCYFSPP